MFRDLSEIVLSITILILIFTAALILLIVFAEVISFFIQKFILVFHNFERSVY
jgi:hypothetical protein